MSKFEISDTLFISNCCTCGVVYGLPDKLDDSLRRNGGTFYCPNGHQMSYTKGKNLEEWFKTAANQEQEITELKLKNNQLIHQLGQLSGQLHTQKNGKQIFSPRDENLPAPLPPAPCPPT